MHDLPNYLVLLGHLPLFLLLFSAFLVQTVVFAKPSVRCLNSQKE